MSLHENQTWTTKTEYAVGDLVIVYDREWRCLKAHTSNVFGNELFNDRCWEMTDRPCLRPHIWE